MCLLCLRDRAVGRHAHCPGNSADAVPCICHTHPVQGYNPEVRYFSVSPADVQGSLPLNAGLVGATGCKDTALQTLASLIASGAEPCREEAAG